MPCQPLPLTVSSKRNPPLKWNLSMTGNLRCFKLYRTHVIYELLVSLKVNRIIPMYPQCYCISIVDTFSTNKPLNQKANKSSSTTSDCTKPLYIFGFTPYVLIKVRCNASLVPVSRRKTSNLFLNRIS